MARPVGAKTRKANPKKTGQAFTLTERESLKAKVQELDLMGYSQRAIAERVDASQSTVHVLLAEIQQDYQDAYVDNRKMWAHKATLGHLNVIMQAQEELAKLRAKGRVRLYREEGTTPGENGGAYSKKSVTKEGGEVAALLGVIQKGWQEIAAIHGIKELPAQIFNLTLNNNVNPFEQMLMAMRQLDSEGWAPTPEPAEGTIVVDATPAAIPDKPKEQP